MKNIVCLLTYYMIEPKMRIEYKENYNKMGVLRIIILQPEVVSPLKEDLEVEDEEEEWVETKVKSFSITAHSQVI